MTNTDLTFYRERLLALRARLQGDSTQMEDDALKDHSKTTSIPTDMEELGSDNADQELTFSLLRNEEDTLDQIEAATRHQGRRRARSARRSTARRKSVKPSRNSVNVPWPRTTAPHGRMQ
jgi:outer membrane receptor for ferrienterochelin and colicin